jgi:hypothetical protein
MTTKTNQGLSAHEVLEDPNSPIVVIGQILWVIALASKNPPMVCEGLPRPPWPNTFTPKFRSPPGQAQLDDFAADCPEKSFDSRGRPLIEGMAV